MTPLPSCLQPSNDVHTRHRVASHISAYAANSPLISFSYFVFCTGGLSSKLDKLSFRHLSFLGPIFSFFVQAVPTLLNRLLY